MRTRTRPSQTWPAFNTAYAWRVATKMLNAMFIAKLYCAYFATEMYSATNLKDLSDEKKHPHDKNARGVRK